MQFDRAIQALCDAQVDFVIVGDLAGPFHGSSYATYLMEFCYARSSANMLRLVAALSPFHTRPRGIPAGLPFIWDEATLRNSTVLTLQTDLGEIDLLAEVAGIGLYEDVKRHSLTVEAAFERRVPVLDLPALIRSKRAAGREKDLSIIPELESLLETGSE